MKEGLQFLNAAPFLRVSSAVEIRLRLRRRACGTSQCFRMLNLGNLVGSSVGNALNKTVDGFLNSAPAIITCCAPRVGAATPVPPTLPAPSRPEPHSPLLQET